ncbi:MAG: stalk domain-containing protein [Bacillota bacterium]
MLPFRWVAQALGAKVNWDEATQTVTSAGGKMRSMFCRCGRPCAAGGGEKQKQTAEENFGQSR